MIQAGESFDLNKDNEILKINSPKASVGGPYAVIFKNIDDRWVIVALDWNGNPSLGIRWFYGGGGNPFSSGNPTWLIIPRELIISILNGLPLRYDFRKNIEQYLSGEIKGNSIII